MSLRLAICVLALALIGCDSGGQTGYPGGLYFAQGAYLMRYALQDGSISIEGHLGDTEIREVNGMGPDHLLITESASVNRRRVSRISWFDLRTGESADLYAGVRAIYLARPGIIVYDDGSDLYAVPQVEGSANQVVLSHPQARVTQLVATGESRMLFELAQESGFTVHSWDAETGDLQRLDDLAAACHLEGAVWIASRDRLLCKRRQEPVASATYVLAGFDGSVEAAPGLPEDRHYLALEYLAGRDAVVLQETWRGMVDSRDRHAIWIHELSTGDSLRLARDVNLGGSVVYGEY